MNAPIGVFDSGLGGLTVLKELHRELPRENLIYLGDTARVPYGTRSKETIARYAHEDACFLVSRGIKLLVIACNSAAAAGGAQIRENFKLPVIDVISPGVNAALKATRNKKIGVIGTSATINSGAYDEMIKTLADDVQVYSAACPLFVTLVEEGWAEHEVTQMIAKEYLTPLITAGVDTLILGCTHYPMLTKILGQVMGTEVKLINSAHELALAVSQTLTTQKKLKTDSSLSSVRYYLTDIPQKFVTVGENFLGRKIEPVEQVEIPSS